jgi:hypothetical protein
MAHDRDAGRNVNRHDRGRHVGAVVGRRIPEAPVFVHPTNRTRGGVPYWVWLIGAAIAFFAITSVLALALVLHFTRRAEHPFGAAQANILPNQAPDAPPSASPPAASSKPPSDADYRNPALEDVDARRVLVRMEQESTVDKAGDARTKLVIHLEPKVHATIRRTLTRQVIAGREVEIPLRMKNVLDYLDLDATGTILEDVTGEFGDDTITEEVREVGFAKHQDGRWIYSLTSDPKVTYDLVEKKRSQVVTVRGVQAIGGSQLSVTNAVITLPEGAHDIRIEGKPSQLTYRLPEPATKGFSEPTFQLEQRPHILTAMYKLYGDRRFPKQWAARSAFYNDGDETLTNYRVRYRIAGYSDWSPWQQSDKVFKGQTVVDTFRPVIDPKVEDIRTSTRATIEVEYEYAHADGKTIRESQSAGTKFLGFNDGVYTDVLLDMDSPWCELIKGMPLLLASFTAGNDPVMREVARHCRESAGGAEPTEGDKEAVRFLAAFYDLMRTNVAYETAQGSMIDGVPRQHLKFGRDVLQTKTATCINTAITFASVAEAAGLEPLIVVIPNHAFMAVRLPKSKQPLFIETTGATTTANAPFAAACKKAEKEFRDAMQSGLLLLIDVKELRNKGVTPPELTPVGDDVLTRWDIRSPKSIPPVEADDSRDIDASALAATIVDVQKVADVTRDGKKGMAFHVHLQIRGGRDVPCQVFVISVDKNKRPVRSDMEGYSVGGILVNSVAVTPTSDDQEWNDLELFIPYSAIKIGRGTHELVAAINVVSDDKLLTDPPGIVPFKIIMSRAQ